MNGLEILSLISKIAVEAPILLPDALKVLADQNQVFADFQKLITDFQGIKVSTTTPPAVAS